MPGLAPGILVVRADEAAQLDGRAIDTGVASVALMQRAGAAAAGEIARRRAGECTRGILVLAGPGNNGGDGWVVARALHAAGHRVQVWEAAPPRSPDAARERSLALADGVARADAARVAGEGIVVDALLGTGAAGPLRGAIADGARCITEARERGAVVVALDMPTGVDATSGAAAADDAVHADLTITFGTLKRGHLLARARCGHVVVVDIGLPRIAGVPPEGDTLPRLVDHALVATLLPPIAATAHKGDKGRVAIVGGAEGMAGAVILAAWGALRAGAGLVKVVTHPASLEAVRAAVPQALTLAWDGDAGGPARNLAEWADALAIGPGLGTSPASRSLVERLLASGQAPVVLDADALNVFAGDARALRGAIGTRRVLLTPHPLEMARLAGVPSVADVLAGRFDVGAALARETGATVLLKGPPTVVSAPDGRRLVSATGTAALATGGSGDVLTGMAATLLAQSGDPLHAGAVAAWAHGRAAEIATARAGDARGIALDEIVAEVANAAWGEPPTLHMYPVLAELP